MKFVQQLWRVEASALISLILVSLFAGVVVYLGNLNGSGDITPKDAAILTSMVYLFYYVFPVTLLIAPLYVVYLRRGWMPKWAVYVVSSVAGLVNGMTGSDPAWLVAGVVSALLIVLIVDVLAKRWLKLRRHRS